MLPSARYKNLGSARASSTHVIFPPFDRPKLFYSWIGFCLNFWHCRVLGIHMCRYCVCYIHEEFCRLLNVLMNSTVVDENCSCECEFCSQGLDLQVRLRKSIPVYATYSLWAWSFTFKYQAKSFPCKVCSLPLFHWKFWSFSFPLTFHQLPWRKLHLSWALLHATHKHNL